MATATIFATGPLFVCAASTTIPITGAAQTTLRRTRPVAASTAAVATAAIFSSGTVPIHAATNVGAAAAVGFIMQTEAAASIIRLFI